MKTTTILSIFQNALHAYNQMCEPILKQFDISQVSFDILMFLNNNPQYTTAQEISQVRNIKKNLVSVHVEKLVCAGLLERGSIAGDRRKVSLSCTKKSEPIIKAGLAIQKTFHDTLTQGVSKEQWNVYREVIETMDANAKSIASQHNSEVSDT